MLQLVKYTYIYLSIHFKLS